MAGGVTRARTPPHTHTPAPPRPPASQVVKLNGGMSVGVELTIPLTLTLTLTRTRTRTLTQVVKLNGGMTVGARDGVLAQFKDDFLTRVILISLKAGGVALNLTVASHIYLMDPWWNPAGEPGPPWCGW